MSADELYFVCHGCGVACERIGEPTLAPADDDGAPYVSLCDPCYEAWQLGRIATPQPHRFTEPVV